MSFDEIINFEQLSGCMKEYLYDIGDQGWNTNNRLERYVLSNEQIVGNFPENANFATELYWLDISDNGITGKES